MGRYYDGDIDGKFMFAIQSSDDGIHFGAVEADDGWIEYIVPQDALTTNVRDGITACKDALGTFKNRIDTYFQKKDTFTERGMAEEMSMEYNENITEDLIKAMLVQYARLRLGTQIETWMIAHPGEDCTYNAEC